MTFVRESFIVFRRQVRMNLRNPAWVLIGVMQPVLYLVLFGPLLKPLVDDFGVENPYTFLVPGLLVQLGMFGAFFAGFGLIGEWREGVVEAERVTPASRTALLVGRLSRDVAQLFVQALILVGLGWAMGMRAPIDGVIIGVLLTLLVGGACAAASNALALTTKSEDVMAPVINMVMMPVLLLSGILLPMTHRSRVAAAGQRLHAVPVDRRRRPRHLHRRLLHQRACSGAPTWALGLFALAALVGHRGLPQGERLTSAPLVGSAEAVLAEPAPRLVRAGYPRTGDGRGRWPGAEDIDEAGVAARLRGGRRRRRCSLPPAAPSSRAPTIPRRPRTATGARRVPPSKPVCDDVAVDPPPKLTEPLLSSDVLVYSQNTLDKDTIEKIKEIKGVDAVEPISMGRSSSTSRRSPTPRSTRTTFRRFTPPGTAQTQAVWDRVAGGEIAVEPAIGEEARAEGRLHAARQRVRGRRDPHRCLRRDPRPHHAPGASTRS